MKKLSECELSFRDLNQIPRSSRQKQQTFHKIMHEVSGETDTRRPLLPKMLTAMASLAACFLFVFIIWTETNYDGSTHLRASIEGKEIVQMGLASSNSENSFIPINEEFQKNIYMINDDDWNTTLNEMIKNAEMSTYKPVSAPLYDLLITLKSQELLKIKVWVEEGQVYYKELDGEEYYVVPKSKNEEIMELVKPLQKDIQGHF